jgi:hypothetical protein
VRDPWWRDGLGGDPTPTLVSILHVGSPRGHATRRIAADAFRLGFHSDVRNRPLPHRGELERRSSGKCLDVANASMESTAVNQYDCHNGPNQQWKLVPLSDGYVAIEARHSGQCLDVAYAKQEASPINQYPCHKAPNQQFKLVERAVR